METSLYKSYKQYEVKEKGYKNVSLEKEISIIEGSNLTKIAMGRTRCC